MAEKLCEICGKPVTSGAEGSWSRDPEGKKRFFHDRCLKEIAESPVRGQSHNIKPFEPMLWELHLITTKASRTAGSATKG